MGWLDYIMKNIKFKAVDNCLSLVNLAEFYIFEILNLKTDVKYWSFIRKVNKTMPVTFKTIF